MKEINLIKFQNSFSSFVELRSTLQKFHVNHQASRRHVLICVLQWCLIASEERYCLPVCVAVFTQFKICDLSCNKKANLIMQLLPFIFIRSARCYIIEFYDTFYHVFALQLCTALFRFSSLATVFNCSQYGHVVEQHFFASRSLIWCSSFTTSTSYFQDMPNGLKKIERAMQSRSFTNPQNVNVRNGPLEAILQINIIYLLSMLHQKKDSSV